MDKRQILEKLARIRAQDPFYRDGNIVSSVSTEPLDVSLDAYRIFSDTNALDTFIFPSVAALEEDVVGWLGSLLDKPDAKGYVTTGGTESNIAALYAAKKKYPGRKEIVVPRTAHYSIKKAADLMGLKIRWAEVDGRYRARAESVGKNVNQKTLAVVATAGTASLGAVDPLEEINDLCGDVFFHVDAAFGGFVLPFLGRKIGFSLSNLDSITVDPHKMGCCPIPAGCIVFRDPSCMEGMSVEPPYIPVSTSTLSGSRSGGAVAAVWAAVNLLGIEGYRRIVAGCMENTRFLCETLKDVEGVSLVTEPEMNIVGIRLADLEETAEALHETGWRIAVNRELSCIRFVVMPHIKKKHIKRFKSDVKKALKPSYVR